MRKIKFQLFIVFLTGILVLNSCKKELSCEHCKTAEATMNKPPVALAGPDKTISLPTDSVTVDGMASYDPDGTIINYAWTRISGPVSFIFGNAAGNSTAIRNLQAGVYFFELTVTDNGGLSGKDTLQVTINDPGQVNRPPVANAGPDQILTLPLNSTQLDGSGSTDPDNNIVNYAWTKISGPASFTIANPSAVQTGLSNLVLGVYEFELKVTDALGLFSRDTIKITVRNPNTTCNICQLVFVSARDGNDEIYTCNADGTNIQRLTNNGARDDYPVWSPDGTKIAFISERSGNQDLYIMNSDGSNVVRKTFFNTYLEYPSWSPDGTKIVFSTFYNNAGSMNLWVVDLASGTSNMLFTAPGWDNQPSWSPDGSKIALVSDWMAYDMVWDIYLINADGTGMNGLTGNIFDHLDYFSPNWSPNGSKLAFAIAETVGIDLYNTSIGVMNVNGSGLTPLVPGAAYMTKTSWSGDGTKIAYTSIAGNGKDISWVAADGSASGIIVTNGWNADWRR